MRDVLDQLDAARLALDHAIRELERDRNRWRAVAYGLAGEVTSGDPDMARIRAQEILYAYHREASDG